MKKSLKIGILAGGLGSRLSEETYDKPKPMVAVGDQPMLWHIMNSFDQQGFSDFVIALGYKGEVIKRWLLDMHELGGDIFLNRNGLKITENLAEQFNNWTITALETGQKTQTGGRVAKMLKKNQGERMLITYGDGLADVDVVELVKFHESHGKLATLTCVRPPARFGHLEIQGKKVVKFGEKSQLDVGWINGGYFVLESEVAEFVLHDEEPFETGALSRLVRAGELMAFEHTGFWHPMDTIRERDDLAKLAQSENPPWLKTRK